MRPAQNLLTVALLALLPMGSTQAADSEITAPTIVKLPSERERSECYGRYDRYYQEGDFTPTLTISAEGEVTNVELPPGAPPWMAKAAECIASKSVFKPGTMNGQPIEARATLPFHFRQASRDDRTRELVRPQVKSSADEIIEIYRRCYPAGLDVQSQVLFQITITKGGTVKAPKLLESSGNQQIDLAGLCIIQELRFRPAKSGSTPTTATMTWPILVRPPPPPA